MNFYHVQVEQDGDWFIGRVMEREGITTQGRTLDELLFMVRDAIALMWNEKGVQLELVVSGKALTSFERKARKKRPTAEKRKWRMTRSKVD